MQIYREEFNDIPISPIRQLYGKKEDSLLAPLDLCTYRFENGNERFEPPDTLGILNSASVKDSSSAGIGTIDEYDWPPVDINNVNPVITIKTNQGIDISSVPDGHAPELDVNVGDAVVLDYNNIPGQVVNLVELHPYPEVSKRVKAYRIDFSQHLLTEIHGARVLLKTTKELLGMLLTTQNESNGKCSTLVYPAYLV